MRIVYQTSKPKACWKILSPIIRWFDHPDFFKSRDASHCSIRVYSPDFKAEFTSESSLSGVGIRNHLKFIKENELVDIIPFEVAKEQWANIMADIARHNEFTPYDSMGLIGKAWKNILKWLGYRVSNPLKDGGRSMDCAEWSGHLLKKHLGWNLGDTQSIGVYELTQRIKVYAIRQQG